MHMVYLQQFKLLFALAGYTFPLENILQSSLKYKQNINESCSHLGVNRCRSLVISVAPTVPLENLWGLQGLENTFENP